MRTSLSLKVNKIFSAIQEGGQWAGMPAVFIRLSGCNTQCATCNVDHSVSTVMHAQEIADKIYELTKDPKDVVGIMCAIWTGGEPLMQLNIWAVVTEVRRLLDERVSTIMAHHLETNGTFPAFGSLGHRADRQLCFEWITLSPKSPGTLQLVAAPCPIEVRVVLTPAPAMDVCPNQYRQIKKLNDSVAPGGWFIQPCWHENGLQRESNMRAAIAYVRKYPNWRLSLQTPAACNEDR